MMAVIRVLPIWIVFALWTAITIVGSKLSFPHDVPLDQLISEGPAWGVIAAALFLCVATEMRDWKALGFAPPAVTLALRLSWLPLLVLAATGFVTVASGLPPAGTLLITLVNCLFVGFSEEFMFRGLLLRSLSRNLRFLGAATGSSLLFGLVHSLNGLVTGDFPSAVTQSLSAAMIGFFFLALRLRTGSLFGPILLHAMWDFVLLTFAVSSAQASGPASPEAHPISAATDLWMSLLIVLPLFLLAIFYLRRVSDDSLPR